MAAHGMAALAMAAHGMAALAMAWHAMAGHAKAGHAKAGHAMAALAMAALTMGGHAMAVLTMGGHAMAAWATARRARAKPAPRPRYSPWRLRWPRRLDVAIPTASLAAEARAAATGTAPAARHHGAPHLPPGLTVAAAFGFVLGHLADVILFNAPLAAAGRDGPEPVHEMRVAVRRLRSAIAVFRPAGGCPAIDAASLGLKALADRLAPARDWDVFVAETAVNVAKALPDDPSLRRLRAAAERRRRHAYAELRAWLATPDFRRLGIALAGLAGGRAWMAPLEPKQLATLALGLDEFASRALARRLHRLASAGKAIEHLDPEALHAIRLHAKRMRYVAEVFAPLYPGKPTRRFMRRLATLQDRLGRLNDGSVANGLLGELGARAHAAGLVRGFLAARSDDTRGRIARAWERFHRLEPFWS